MKILMVVAATMLLMSCAPAAPEKMTSPQPTIEQFDAKKKEAKDARTELRTLKGREPDVRTVAVELDESGEEIIRNASKKRLVQVKIVEITADDGSQCSPRERVTTQVIRTKERRYICGKIGKVGDIFTIEWTLLKQWK